MSAEGAKQVLTGRASASPAVWTLISTASLAWRLTVGVSDLARVTSAKLLIEL
jgi:hypothetical protein